MSVLLELELPALPESVPQARLAISALCQHLDIDDDIVDRVRLAVTEACGNCVRNAYPGQAGNSTYLLEASADGDTLSVVIHDYGVGLVPGRRSGHAGLGLGMRLVDELADWMEIASRPGEGTRVTMRLRPASPFDDGEGARERTRLRVGEDVPLNRGGGFAGASALVDRNRRRGLEPGTRDR